MVTSAHGAHVVATASSSSSFNDATELSPIRTRSRPRTSATSFNDAVQSLNSVQHHSMSAQSRPPRSAPVQNSSKGITPGFMEDFSSLFAEEVEEVKDGSAMTDALSRNEGRPWTSSTLRATTYNTVGLSQPSPVLAAWPHLSPERRRRTTNRRMLRSEPSNFGSGASFDSATSIDRQSSLESAKASYATKLSNAGVGDKPNPFEDFDMIGSPGPRLRSPPGLRQGGV